MERFCNHCQSSKPVEDFYTRGKAKGYSAYCKPCVRERNKEIRSRNPEKIAEYQRRYQKENRERISAQVKEYASSYKDVKKFKYQTDPLYKTKILLRAYTYRAFTRFVKNQPTESFLGCTYDEAKKHIEKQFVDGMSWENHGDWHIDHIIPLASAKTTQEAEKLCHFSNLQPLWAKDNLSKGAR